jgi:hypothetical protein
MHFPRSAPAEKPAAVASVGLMLLFAPAIGRFVSDHPILKMLALAFLEVVGARRPDGAQWQIRCGAGSAGRPAADCFWRLTELIAAFKKATQGTGRYRRYSFAQSEAVETSRTVR